MKRRLSMIAAAAAVSAALAFSISAANADTTPPTPADTEVSLPPECGLDELQPGDSVVCGTGPDVTVEYDEGND